MCRENKRENETNNNQTTKSTLQVRLPELTPVQAYALADLLDRITHTFESHYREELNIAYEELIKEPSD